MAFKEINGPYMINLIPSHTSTPYELSIHLNLKLINYTSRLNLITTHLCNIKQLNFKVQENIIFSCKHGDAENTTPPLQKRNPPLNFKCP